MLAEQQHGQHLRNNMLLAYLQVLLIYLSRLYSEQFTSNKQSADRELLNRFRTLISKHFIECHDVMTYADLLSLSAGHLCCVDTIRI